MTQPRIPARKLNRWHDRWDTIENLAAEINDALPTLLAASAFLAADAFPSSTTGSETHGEGEHADPVLNQVLADLEPQQRDAIAEHLREIAAVTSEVRGHLRRVARLKDIIVNRRDPRTYDVGGHCKACGVFVTGAADDRLRALYCHACYMAWCRYRDLCNQANDIPNHTLFETERRRKAEEKAARERDRQGAA